MHIKTNNKKYTMILLIGVMVFIFKPLQVYSQSKSVLDSIITYKAKNISLYDGLNEIGDIVNYEFSYNADIVSSDNEIKVNLEEITLRKLLTKILNDTTLDFCVADKQIIIRKKNSIKSISAILLENDL